MSLENVGKFQELLNSDEALQAKFRAAAEACAAEEKDELASFEAVVAPLAGELGLPFTYDEAKQYALGNSDLTDEQLDSVNGGWTFCICGGYGSGVDAKAKCDDFGGSGWGWCAVAGVGLLLWNS